MDISKQEDNRYTIFQKVVQNKSKGYWRVKSVDILNRRINQKKNISHNLYLLDKIKKLSIQNLPSFQITKYPLPPTSKPTTIPITTKEQSTLFITNAPSKARKPKSNHSNSFTKTNINIIRNTLFGKFPIEASIYNNMTMFSIKVSTARTYPRTLKEVIRDSKKIAAYDEALKKIRSALVSKQSYESGNSSFSYGYNPYRNNNNNYFRYLSNFESSNEVSQSCSGRKDMKDYKFIQNKAIVGNLKKIRKVSMKIKSNNSFGYKNNNNNVS